MNKIDIPTIDDIAAIHDLVGNPRLKSYPKLQDLALTICALYAKYDRSFALPIFGFRPPTDEQIALLLGHFKSPPKDVGFIREMREESDSRECPMCGSLHSGTLDHYLSKNTYPLLSVFSKNLVPACKCNSKRGEKLHGSQPGERILHPYYDACLSERLVRAQFDDLGAVPKVSVELTVTAAHPMFAAINFHFNEVVKKSAVTRYLADRWSSLVRKPSLVVRAFEKNFATQAEVQAELLKELNKLDDVHRGKNNWNSMFVHGLLVPPTLAWLTGRLSDPTRPSDSPLV